MNLLNEKIVDGISPFEACHASSILKLKNDNILAVWFAGSKESGNDTGIWMSKRNKDSWSFPEIIAKIAYEPHWNPVLFRAPDESIKLYFKVGQEIKDWITWTMSSADEAETWSWPQKLVCNDFSGGRGPVKNKPLILSNGVIAAPASTEQEQWESFVDLSDNGGKSWGKSQIIPMDKTEIDYDKLSGSTLGLIQPSIWESKSGYVHMLLRSNNGFIYRSDSEDFGQTWCKAYKTAIPNNNSGIDLSKLHDNSLALVYNHSTGNWGPRNELHITFSYDNGNSWTDNRILISSQKEYEFSYPAVIAIKEQLAISFTYKRKNISFISGSREMILQKFKAI
jgi:predicted neuraminidase